MSIIDKLFGKAINKRVANITSTLFNQGISSLLNNGQVIINPNGHNYYAEKGFEQVGAVYECVDLIVKKFVACPWIIYRVKNVKEYKKYQQLSQSPDAIGPALLAKAKALEEVSHAKIEQLLENPNPETDGDDMWELLAALYLLKGNAYLYGNAGNDSDRAAGRWSELWGIPADMTITAGLNFMDPVVQYQMTNYLQNKPFPANQVKHLRTLNPRYDPSGTQLYGIPPLKAYLYSMDILRNADKEADKQIKNGGQIGLLTPENKEDSWGDKQIEQTGQSLKTAYSSTDRLDRVIPVSIPLKWTQIGLNSADLELLKMSDAKADDIYRCFHMPLQFRSQDTATYNNLPVANRQLAYNAVAPICRKFSKGVTDFVCKPYNTSQATYIIEKDFMGLPELNDDMKSVAEWLDKSWDLSPNEKREVKRYGRSSEPGMDQIWVPITQTPMAKILDGTVIQGSSHVTAAVAGQQPAAKTYFEYLNGEPPEQTAPAVK